MKRKSQTDISALHLFMGLLMGFLLGSTVVYWHSNRQNDRLFTEAMEKVMSMFSAHTFHTDSGDSIIFLMENKDITNTPGQPNNPLTNNRFRAEQQLIAQDKLLYTKILSLNNSNEPVSETNRKLDSLLGKSSQPAQDLYFFIEFWESPLNYVGYKMGKNKIMLYGINSYDLVSLTNYKGKTYLKYLNEYYPLELTTAFKPLVPVTDYYFLQDIHNF